MTIRKPSQIEKMFDERLLCLPPSNIHVIIAEFDWKTRDDIASTYEIAEGFVHNNHSIDCNYNTGRYFHNNQTIGHNNDISPLKLLCVKTIQEAYEKLNGKNPYAISAIGHCSKDEFEQGDGSWLHYEELAKLINSNQGCIWRVSISGCKSKIFGDNLELHTNKILMMDARHKDEPNEGQEYFDGSNDGERSQAKLEIITKWSMMYKQIFTTKYFETNDPEEWTFSLLANSKNH